MLGDTWNVSPNIISWVEEFTCLIYGYPKDTSVNVVRTKMLKKMVGENVTLSRKSKVDLSRIPPCQDSLVPHIQRVNHRVAGYKRAHQAIIESPKPYDDGQGWVKTDQEGLHAIWSKGPILPKSLVDLLEADQDGAERVEEVEEDEECEADGEIDFDALLEDDEY